MAQQANGRVSGRPRRGSSPPPPEPPPPEPASFCGPDLATQPRLDDDPRAVLAEVAGRARALGLRRVQMLAWRDLDDPEAGGSELHAHRVAGLWAEHGLEVVARTSTAAGHTAEGARAGYRVVRRAGRYAVFPRSMLGGLLGVDGRYDGLVEIWNGMPFFSPLWARCPRIVFLHHVHAEMWRMVLPPNLARVGELVERRLAPPLYRGSRIVTLSASSKREIVAALGFAPHRVTVAEPGVDARFSPPPDAASGPGPEPLVVAVGRLVPVKRFEALLDVLVAVRARHPGLRAVIAGEGYERPRLEERIRTLGATDWIELPGHLRDDELLALYRRAWVLTSASQREGWGMTVSEAAACGTPAVVTGIAGHRDAVEDGRGGLLVEHPADLTDALDRVLADPKLRRALGAGALARARRLSWERTAAATLGALVDEADVRLSARARRGGAGL